MGDGDEKLVDPGPGVRLSWSDFIGGITLQGLEQQALRRDRALGFLGHTRTPSAACTGTGMPSGIRRRAGVFNPRGGSIPAPCRGRKCFRGGGNSRAPGCQPGRTRLSPAGEEAAHPPLTWQVTWVLSQMPRFPPEKVIISYSSGRRLPGFS